MPPSWGASALLHPIRRSPGPPPALPHEPIAAGSDGILLEGWRFPARAPARGVTLVYLHGIGDDRVSGTWLAERFTARGLDVVAFDGRAHGASGGEACTCGVLERRDLSRVLDAAGARSAVLLGVSLGAAVALQAAPEDPRVAAVVAVAPFSDLETVARERAPWFASARQVNEALAMEGGFRVADASPVRAAERIGVPVLLVHGADDRETPPAHSRRIAARLRGPHVLRVVEGAGHGDALARVITEVEAWVDEAVAAPHPVSPRSAGRGRAAGRRPGEGSPSSLSAGRG
jgi:pimeloyl-ACP methyl ester carboxylesterase